MALPGRYAAMGSLATSATLTHWFRDNFSRELVGPTAFAILAAEAEAVPPGADGLVVLPYFSGERSPIYDPQARGVIFGLNLTHGRGHVYRALLEGIGFGTRHIFETYAEAGAPLRQVRAVGGGTRNRVWLQTTSDIVGQPQALCRRSRGAAYGDAFLAARAVGAAVDGDIDLWNPVDGEVTPDRDAVALYDGLYGVYRGVYDRTRDLMVALGAVH